MKLLTFGPGDTVISIADRSIADNVVAGSVGGAGNLE